MPQEQDTPQTQEVRLPELSVSNSEYVAILSSELQQITDALATMTVQRLKLDNSINSLLVVRDSLLTSLRNSETPELQLVN